MKLPSLKKEGAKQPVDIIASLKTRSFRVGGYSVAATAIVLAIAVAVNVLANILPASLTQFDTTSNQLFTISDQTEKLLASLDSPINIYWIVQSGSEDSTLENLLNRYKSLSSQIHIEKRDPDVYPTFVQQYTSSVYNNSLVVESGERYRYVDYYDIYEYVYDDYYYYYGYASEVNFAGEGALTSAIDYVVSDNIPKVYTLTGHGEGSISSAFSDAVDKENIEMEDLSLLTLEAVPEDAGCVMIYSPQSDISEIERDMLLSYLQTGGNLLLITDPPAEDSFANLDAVMEYYGVTAAEGVVVEANQNHYIWNAPYYLLPDINYHTITSPLTENGYYVLLPIAQGLLVGNAPRDTVSVTELLTTSSSSFSKIAGYGLNTYEKEDGDIDGPFALAVAVTETVDDETETNIVWVSSASLLDDQTNMQVSGGNQDFFLNSLSWMCEPEASSISIHAKSLSYEYLTIDSSTASILTIVIVGVIPIVYLGVGIYTWVRRKRR